MNKQTRPQGGDLAPKLEALPSKCGENIIEERGAMSSAWWKFYALSTGSFLPPLPPASINLTEQHCTDGTLLASSLSDKSTSSRSLHNSSFLVTRLQGCSTPGYYPDGCRSLWPSLPGCLVVALLLQTLPRLLAARWGSAVRFLPSKAPSGETSAAAPPAQRERAWRD